MLNTNLPASVIEAGRVLIRKASHLSSAGAFNHEVDKDIAKLEPPSAWATDLVQMLDGKFALQRFVKEFVGQHTGEQDVETDPETMFNMGIQALEETKIPGTEIVSRILRSMKGLFHRQGIQEPESHEFMTELWSVGKDALRAVDLPVGVFDDLHDIFANNNSPTV